MRTVYLTATKALQDQVLRDFYTVDVTDMRGQMNYPCLEVGGLMVNEGPCHIGYACPVKQGGCRYYDQLKWAAGGEIVVTNYAYYMTQLSQPEPPLGHFDLMICDEGHLVADVITSFLIFAVSTKDCRSLGIPWPSPNPQTILGWKTWAVSVLPNVVVQGRTYSNDMEVANLRYAVQVSLDAKRAMEHLTKLAGLPDPDNWIIRADGDNGSRNSNDAVEFSPVWPAKYADGVLFDGTSKVMFMSATLTRKSMFLAGVKPTSDSYTFHEYPSAYPLSNRMVWYIPTTAMNRRVSDVGWDMWVNRIDQILRSRPDRKSIIHTTSYSRMRNLFAASSERHRMIQHGSGQTSQAIQVFRSQPPQSGAALVSPVISSGYDFKDDECRCVIIGKLPFPDSRDPLVKARNDRDNEWIPHQVMQTLVQSAGRATRSDADWSEVFVIDDDFWWFWNKFKYLAPSWFTSAVAKTNTIPTPHSV